MAGGKQVKSEKFWQQFAKVEFLLFYYALYFVYYHTDLFLISAYLLAAISNKLAFSEFIRPLMRQKLWATRTLTLTFAVGLTRRRHAAASR